MPASTPEQAQQDWEDNTTQEAWEQGVENPRQSVAEGLAEFWGGNEGDYSDVQGKWDDRVQQAMDDDRYEQNTRGKGDTWRERAREGAQNNR